MRPAAPEHNEEVCHIQDLNANQALSLSAVPRQESDAFVLPSRSPRFLSGLGGRNKIKGERGFWQKTASTKEKDVSILRTIPVSAHNGGSR